MFATLNYVTPLAFSLSTLLIIWSFGGGQIAEFWARSPVLALGLVILTAATPMFSFPIFKGFKEQKFWASKNFKTALLAGVVLAVPFALIYFFLRSTSGEGIVWITPYLKKLTGPTWYAYLLIPFVAAPILELYWRGVIAPQWGLFTTAFLEGLIWGFASQHFVFFLVAGSLSLIGDVMSLRLGLMSALGFRSVWTLAMMLALGLSAG